jgi:CheY-like chemotaxis protein
MRLDDFAMSRNEQEIIILQEVSEKNLVEMTVKLKETVKKYIYETQQNIDMDFSYGVACYPHDGNNSKELLEKAKHYFVSIKEERLKKKIMVVDDEPVVVDVLKEILLHEGYRNVIGVFTGEEALQRSRVEKIDLIILDLRMPQVNGYEVIARLKEYVQTKDIPILIMSGSEAAIDQLKESVARAIPIINKPIDVEHLRLMLLRSL